MNLKISFNVKAYVYGAEFIPTTEEMSEAIRETLQFALALNAVVLSDVTMEIIDED